MIIILILDSDLVHADDEPYVCYRFFEHLELLSCIRPEWIYGFMVESTT